MSWRPFGYYGYRFYNPSTGRWLGRDPLYEIEKRLPELLPEGPNTYGFIGNNPVGNWDYLGLIAGGRGSAPNAPSSVGPRRGGAGAGGRPTPSEDPVGGSVHSEAEAAQARHFPGQVDPYGGGYRHCVAACLLSRRYGRLAGKCAVYIHDAAHEHPDTNPNSVSDMEAEQVGLALAKLKGSCEKNCLNAYPALGKYTPQKGDRD